MRKLGLYAGIIIIVFFFFSCTKQENERITIGGSDIPNMMAKTKVFESLWDMESTSVSDSDNTITLGMLFEDFDYCEEELPTEVIDNFVGIRYVYGAWHDVYFHPYKDFTIYTSDYNPLSHAVSDEKIYIVQIDLNTSRFCTSRGIAVGATVNELKDAYCGEHLIEIDQDIPVRFRYLYEEEHMSTSFYIDVEQQRVTRITLALVSK